MNLPTLQMDYAVWRSILNLVMYNNYVKANGQMYRETKDTASGTQVAPQFATLYAFYKFKSIFVDEDKLFLGSFIDDRLMMFRSYGRAELITPKKNSLCNLKFTWISLINQQYIWA